MAHSTMPMSLLLQQERLQHTRLLQLSLREQRLVEQFTTALEAVAEDRRSVQDSLSSIRTAIQSKKKVIALLQCPPELRQWQALHAPLVDPHEVELLMPSPTEPAHMFADSAVAFLPLSAQERNTIESTVQSSSVPRLEKVDVPSVVFDKAFVPFVHPTTKTLMKRPCNGDVSVMRSSAPNMGRVVVALRATPPGQLVFAESPWLSVAGSEATFQQLLPPLLQQAYTLVNQQQRVFEAQPTWDKRLVMPFFAYLDVRLQGLVDATLRDAAMLPLLLKSLSNPLKDMTPAAVDSLCDFVQFLRASLPSCLEGVVSEDDACRFLAAYQTNAASFQSSAAQMYLLDTQGASSPSSSVYTAGPQTRCLFGLVSLLEHSCQPNAALVWHRSSSLRDADDVVVEVRAIRPIAAGERLSIAYIPTVLPREERQALLWKRYWFHCQCCRCVAAPELLRGARCVADGVTIAPIGTGASWGPVDGSCPSEPATAEGPRAAALAEADMNKLADSAPMTVLERVTSSPTLSVFHYVALRSFVSACSAAASLRQGDASHTIDSLTVYAVAVARAAFVDPAGPSPLSSLLDAGMGDPVDLWFDQVGDSLATRRERLTSSSAQSAAKALPDISKLAEKVLAIREDVGDNAHLVVSFTVAVWELLFGVVHSVLTRSPAVDASALESGRLHRLRRGAALGLWLMQLFALVQHESSRVMQWQAVLLESTQ